MAVTIRPSAAAAKVLPGDDLTLRFAVLKAPGDAALSAFVLNDAGGIVLTSLETFREIRVPLTDAELAELPPFPPSIREQARREGRIELVSSARSGGEPIPVTAGDTVVATVETAAVRKSSALISGELVLEGAVWGRNEAPIAVLVGRGSVEAVPVPSRIDVNILPGAVEERDVTIFKAPVEATAVVVIDTASPHVRLARVMAFGTEQRFFTDVVDEWFAGKDTHAQVKIPGRKPMNVNDPYFRYIRHNISGQADLTDHRRWGGGSRRNN